MMGWDGNGFAWYGGMGFSFFLLVLHDTLFALRLRYTIEAVHVVVYFLVFISLFAAWLWSLLDMLCRSLYFTVGFVTMTQT
jgi:hypothetical protein